MSQLLSAPRLSATQPQFAISTTGKIPAATAGNVYHVVLKGTPGLTASANGTPMQAVASAAGMNSSDNNDLSILSGGLKGGTCAGFHKQSATGMTTAKQTCDALEADLVSVDGCKDNQGTPDAATPFLTSTRVTCQARNARTSNFTFH